MLDIIIEIVIMVPLFTAGVLALGQINLPRSKKDA